MHVWLAPHSRAQAPSAQAARAAEWEAADTPLMTRWADDVSPRAVKERPYPRPQMKRPRWQTLNGLWNYAIVEGNASTPSSYDGHILVPFPVESALSGVGERVGPEQRLWYRRSFEVPPAWAGARLLLHFGAVDWDATVYVNGERVGRHKGGYDLFTLDITDALRPAGEQELAVRVQDPTDTGTQPRGKQVRDPHGIVYTPVTGLWQTVWLEPVPSEASIQDLTLVPVVEAGRLRVTVEGRGADGLKVRATAKRKDGTVVGRAEGKVGTPLAVPVPKAQLWSPSTPYLYDLNVRLTRAGETLDEVDSYFGMRSIGLGQGPDGKTRMMLNGEALFQYGPLDQGYWPDGLYTAPTDEALAFDLEITKELGFNMTRKHVKVEPSRWYYLADSLGLLVWQDMPSGWPGERTATEREQFEKELREMIDDFYNHPSIVMWVIFNEGWGQYDTERITQWAEEYDTSRLISAASGWVDKDVGDIRDAHSYPGPAAPPAEEDRAIVLGEFGGLGLPMAAHTWQAKDNWGYHSFENPAELTDAYLNRLDALRLLIDEPGLSAAVYTQITDIEAEVNGLLTYDRDMVKMNTYRVARANRRLYEEPPPGVATVLPTAGSQTTRWHYTTEEPGKGWMEPDFDADGWPQGTGGFGKKGSPGAEINTAWTTSDLWLRRTFDLDSVPGRPHLLIHHIDAATVYLNGQEIADLKGWTPSYNLVPLGEVARRAFREGQNTLAIHMRNEGGHQYIDAGIVDVVGRD